MDIQSKENKLKEDSSERDVSFSENDDYLYKCPTTVDEDENSIDCIGLNYPCITCDGSIDCRYGGLYNYTCTVKPKVVCNVSSAA